MYSFLLSNCPLPMQHGYSNHGLKPTNRHLCLFAMFPFYHEAVDEPQVLKAIEAGEYSAEELQKYLRVKEVVMLKLTDPAKVKK